MWNKLDFSGSATHAAAHAPPSQLPCCEHFVAHVRKSIDTCMYARLCSNPCSSASVFADASNFQTRDAASHVGAASAPYRTASSGCALRGMGVYSPVATSTRSVSHSSTCRKPSHDDASTVPWSHDAGSATEPGARVPERSIGRVSVGVAASARRDGTSTASRSSSVSFPPSLDDEAASSREAAGDGDVAFASGWNASASRMP
mmetsp:Transcript_13788/g.49465  ORF Transcript_13788/g.49465 Transcript_13788/m.49465 type:complete len:203 (-) Transcript_13788:124-732(-)